MQRALHYIVVLVTIALLGGCGGGGSAASVTPPPPPNVPNIVLFVVSGHEGLLDGDPSASYLHTDAGPEITDDLEAAGQIVEPRYYVDDAYQVGIYGGYYQLEDDMAWVAQNYVPYGTKAVVIAHSHGGVWAHAAVRATPQLEVHAQIDLDCSSYGWGTVGHDAQNAALDGDPRDAYLINGVYYDLEDVVFANVTNNLGVRSGDLVPNPFFPEDYDEAWNMRTNGTRVGLSDYYSYTSHEEVHAAGGATLYYVRGWLRDRLGL